MTVLQATLTTIGVVFGLATLAGGLWVAFRSSARDAANRRLRDENVDLVRRLEYVEPKLSEALSENALLRELHNPTSRLEEMSSAGRQRHAETVRLLKQQHEVLEDIQEKVSTPGGRS